MSDKHIHESDYDKEIEEAFNKFIADALTATETESQGRYILGMTDEYRECFDAGANYQKEKDAERILNENSENAVMKWLHKNYLESYDKYTSSYHRMIAKDLLKALKEASEG